MNTNPVVTANRILQEQVEIEELTVHLLSELAKRQCVRQRIVKLFQDLRERVVAHFCDEERGGFVEQQVRENPELAAMCRDLCREHQGLQAELDELLRIAEDRLVDNQWWETLESRFHDVSIKLANHEFRENAILQELVDEE
ncbi:MAG: hypothetical protein R3C28_03265 [Pirellulaceae bacterium]